MAKIDHKFRKPAHTLIERTDGNIIVSTVHMGNRIFDTMAFSIVKGREYTARELAQKQTEGEGSAEQAHKDMCKRFNKNNRDYQFIKTGSYEPCISQGATA